MPCPNSSSGITLRLDHADRFVSFNFAKIACGKEVEAKTGYASYCVGRTLPEILNISYAQIVAALELQDFTKEIHLNQIKDIEERSPVLTTTLPLRKSVIDEEKRFILYLEWEALRSAIAQYLGIEDESIDNDRCHIISIEHHNEETEITLLILPPKEMPKILPCGFTSPPAP